MAKALLAAAGRLLLGISLVLAGLARPAQAQTARLVIVELEPVTLPAPHDKTSLAQELSSAVTAAGCQVVRVCRALDCPDATSGQTSVLSFSGRYQASNFTCSLKVELRRAGGANGHWSSENPVCPAVQLVNDARDAGRRACDELRAIPAAARSTNNPASGPTSLVASAEPASPWTAGRWLGVGAIAAGLGVGAVGVLQALENGDPTRCSTSSAGETVCTGIKRRPLAIPLIAVGAAGLGWGLWQALGFGVEHNDGLTLVTARGRY